MYRYEDIRNFYFENEKGSRVDCQKIDGGLFLYDPSGLGYEEENQYEFVGNTFIKNSSKMKQNIIEGNLEFDNVSYDEYKNFIDFIFTSESLKIIYVPKLSVRTEYYRDIDFTKIEKFDEDDFNILTSPIALHCKTLWYEENEAIYTVTKKDREIRWNFRWNSRFTSYNSRTITYNNKGHIEAPITIEMDGYLINPCISVYDNYNELLYQLKLDITLEEYEKLLYSSKDNDFYIYRQKTDGSLESLFTLDYIDITNINIFRLPKRSKYN